MRCAALYRVSTLRQARQHDDDEETIPMQREAIRRFVDDHDGWTLIAEYAEEGVSAYKHSSAGRDVLQDVLRDAAAHAWDVLLIFKADRLSRQSLEYPIILAKFQESGVRVISVADEVGGKELKSDGQFDKLLRFIEGWQAETESYNTSIRVTEKMRQKATKGQWTGGRPPYGYRLDPQSAHAAAPLMPDSVEGPIVQTMFRLYLDDGIGTPSIARWLNDHQICQRNGKPWSDSLIRRIMQNPIVTGRLAYGRTYSAGRNRRKARGAHDLDQVILSPTYDHLVLVPEPRWQLAMERMASYNQRMMNPTLLRHSRADTGPLLLTGLARCAHCGGPLVSKWVGSIKPTRQGPKKYSHHAYQCQTQATRGTNRCDGQRTYSHVKVERTVLQAVHRVLDTLDTTEITMKVQRTAEQRLWAQTARQRGVNKQLDEARTLQRAWLDRLDQFLLHPETSLYSEDILAGKIREFADRIATLEAERSDLQQQTHDIAEQRRSLAAFLAMKDQWWQQFLAAPRSRQKLLLAHLIQEVRIGRMGFAIIYRFDLATLLGEPTASALEWHDAHDWTGTMI
jgi:DNA invertase Pin-like site-specific DNA recombinase